MRVCETASVEKDLVLACPGKLMITSIDYAKFGPPTENCQKGFGVGACSEDLSPILKQRCLGQYHCEVTIDGEAAESCAQDAQVTC